MRNLKYISLLVTFICFCSCRKELLDATAPSVISEEQVLSSSSGVTTLFATLYRDMPVEDYSFVNGTFGQFPGNGDQYTANWTDEAFDSNAGGINPNVYPGLYKAIRNVNTLLKQIEKATNIDDATKSRYTAEARFVRAYCYFGLVKYYGGIPLILEPQDAPVAQPRNKEVEVWDQIKTDLDFAAENLPANSDYGRANKYVALALESRAMLHAASIGKFGTVQLNGVVGVDAAKADVYMQAAYDAAKTIITDGKYSLYKKYPTDLAKNFQYIFYDCKPGDENPEAIFAKGYDYGTTGRTHSQDLMVLPDYIRSPIGYDNRLQPTLDFVDKFENTDGSPGAFPGAPAAYVHYNSLSEPFAKKDPRFAGTVVAPGTFFRTATITAQKGVIVNGKEYNSNNRLQYFDLATLSFTSQQTPIVGSGNSNNDSKTFWLKKWTDPVTPVSQLYDYSSRTSWLDMRLGEVLLNYAESAFELGKSSSEALGAINQLRDRAGMLPLVAVTRAAIRHERLVETGFENRTYWDYVRWRTLTTEFNSRQEYGLDIYYDVDTKDYVFKKMPMTNKTYIAQRYYSQIPGGERATNPQLIDNPGY